MSNIINPSVIEAIRGSTTLEDINIDAVVKLVATQRTGGKVTEHYLIGGQDKLRAQVASFLKAKFPYVGTLLPSEVMERITVSVNTFLSGLMNEVRKDNLATFKRVLKSSNQTGVVKEITSITSERIVSLKESVFTWQLNVNQLTKRLAHLQSTSFDSAKINKADIALTQAIMFLNNHKEALALAESASK